MRPNVTIGVAGHIDHGKTALTKALTNIETDRLIEEKKRKISIENGFAFLDLEEDWRAAVIDVPGHERFIRQMIAGVAGIDLVLLVIAADEGVMPQTREHLDIIRLLGVPAAMVVITKVSLVEPSFLTLVEADIRQVLNGTDYASAPFFKVDSLTGEGIEALKNGIIDFAKKVKGKNSLEPLRLPIDDVFSIHGYGTIVRGTVFNGRISVESEVKLLPQNQTVRIKQLQVHHEQVTQASAGQRVAANIAGIDLKDVHRGDVLVNSDLYKPTTRLDVLLRGLESMEKPLKQRGPVMFHIGTSSVRGRLILFDRNRWEGDDTIYAQIELEAPVVAKKGDRFVVRRPTPVETLGGGEVIDPLAEKHRFGEQTTKAIEALLKGHPEDWVKTALEKHLILKMDELERYTGLKSDELHSVIEQLVASQTVQIIKHETFVLTEIRNRVAELMVSELQKYHVNHPLRLGMNRAEWLRNAAFPKGLTEAASGYLFEKGKVTVVQHVVRLADFQPHYPPKWEKRLDSVETELREQSLQPSPWTELISGAQLPEALANDFRKYLLENGMAYTLDGERLVSQIAVKTALSQLKKRTHNHFTVQEAKDILGLTRKHLIPLLELFDNNGWTKREGNERHWVKPK
ncbi:MAG: selenocysteine-specific translation elongation factor [Tuberibacillus sp.]